MPCKLCLEDRPLRQSHIVPEFLYRPLYDSKHRFFGLSNLPGRKDALFQKGLREPLLCDGCEQQFSRYEHYASKVFNGRQAARGEIGQREIVMIGLDYAPLKLFLLSLLWRFGVTSIEYLKGVPLGSSEARLHKMLRAEDPGPFNAYPCMMTAVTIDGAHVPDLIVAPAAARIKGHVVWSMVVSGFVLTFWGSRSAGPSLYEEVFLREDGRMRVLIRDLREIEFLHRFSSEIAQARQSRNATNAFG